MICAGALVIISFPVDGLDGFLFKKIIYLRCMIRILIVKDEVFAVFHDKIGSAVRAYIRIRFI